MSDKLQIKRSFTAGAEPALNLLAEGELAVNIPDKRIWVGDATGNPIEIGKGVSYLRDLLDVDVSNAQGGDHLVYGLDDNDNPIWKPAANLGGMNMYEFSYIMKLPPTSIPSGRRLSRDNEYPENTAILYINRTSRDGNDISYFMEEVRAGDWLNIHLRDDHSVYEAYDVAGYPFLNGDIWEIPVIFYELNGDISGGERVRLLWKAQSVVTDNRREPMTTGIHHGGKISKGSGDLEVIVEEGRGLVSNTVGDPFKVHFIDVLWGTQTITITPSTPTITEIHNIYVDQDGHVITMLAQDVTPTVRYDLIRLGWVEIYNNAINKVISAPFTIGQTSHNLSDIFYNLNSDAITKGLQARPCNEGLQIYVEDGSVIIPGANWHINPKNQNTVYIPQQGSEISPITLVFYDHEGEIFIDPQTELPKYYDNHGSKTPLTGYEATIHYLFYTASGYAVQVGARKYKDFADAFRNLDRDKNTYPFAPGANLPGQSFLIAQIIISGNSTSFYDKTKAFIVSSINGETGNKISPIDLTLVPQYLLHTTAAEDLVAGDELSMDVNGRIQKYPATGGEGSFQFTNDGVIHHAAIFLNQTNNHGIIAWVPYGDSEIKFRTAQGNEDGTVTFSPITTKTTSSIPSNLRICRINNDVAGCIWSDSNGVHLIGILDNGIDTAPSIGSSQTLNSGSVDSCDCVWDYDHSNLIGVYSVNNKIYNRYCKVSNHDIHSPPEQEIEMMDGTDVRCTTEGGNIIVTGINNSDSVWREAAYVRWGWPRNVYSDFTNIITVSNCNKHCGLKVEGGIIISQFEYDGTITTYSASYSSGSSINNPQIFGIPVNGVHGDLIRTDSGIGYRIILRNDYKIELWEGTLTGDYDKIYTTSSPVDSGNDKIQALMFGSVFAFGVGYTSESKKVFLIDSSLTRTDHFIGVCSQDVSMGMPMDVDIALPLLRLPRNYPPGTFYYYGPYKYQVITSDHAAMIIESTILESSTA